MAGGTSLGVIGGSGIYQIDGMELKRKHAVNTPFGPPSDEIMETMIDRRTVYFLSRHGRGHRFSPSEVNYRANIYALKSLGVTHLMAVSAVGIMHESIEPGYMVIPEQIFDRTKGTRKSTFFEDGIVGHVSFADPFCEEMREVITKAARLHTQKIFEGGTYVCMEGPQFSTRAESQFYRKTLEPAVIGMTALPEAKLAREAEMSYGLLALATDYDCWHESEEVVSVELVLQTLKANSTLASLIVKEVARLVPEVSKSKYLNSAAAAIMTTKDVIPAGTKERLKLLYGKYF